MKWNKTLLDEKDGFRVTTGGYRFKINLFRMSFAILFLIASLMFFSASSQGIGITNFYLSCPIDRDQPCLNPYFESCDFKECEAYEDIENLAPGFSVGKEPIDMTGAVVFFVFLIFSVAFWINHVRYNKGFEFDLEVD